MSKPAFSKKFQRRLLVMLLDNDGYILTDRLVRADYFEDPINARICEFTLLLYDELRVPPSVAVLVEELGHSVVPEELALYKRRFASLRRLAPTSGEREYILTELRRFVGIQAIKTAIRDAIEPLREGDLEKARTTLKGCLHTGDGDEGPETFYFEEARQRIANSTKLRERGVVRTLIAGLDTVLRNGGLARREVGVILAISNVGKTMALCHMAKSAILQRYKVVYFSLDDAMDLIAERLDGSFTGINLSKLQDSRAQVIRRLTRIGKVYKQSLVIKEGLPRMTVEDLDAFIDKLIGVRFNPDVVIVDYLNLIGSSTTSNWAGNRYKEVGEVVNDLKRLCKKRNVVLWTAAQANRSALGKELTTMAEIAESFEAIMGANVVISLNRTPEEKKRYAMRLFLAKNKSSISEVIVPITTNFEKGAFYRVIPKV